MTAATRTRPTPAMTRGETTVPFMAVTDGWRGVYFAPSAPTLTVHAFDADALVGARARCTPECPLDGRWPCHRVDCPDAGARLWRLWVAGGTDDVVAEFLATWYGRLFGGAS